MSSGAEEIKKHLDKFKSFTSSTNYNRFEIIARMEEDKKVFEFDLSNYLNFFLIITDKFKYRQTIYKLILTITLDDLKILKPFFEYINKLQSGDNNQSLDFRIKIYGDCNNEVSEGFTKSANRRDILIFDKELTIFNVIIPTLGSLDSEDRPVLSQNTTIDLSFELFSKQIMKLNFFNNSINLSDINSINNDKNVHQLMKVLATKFFKDNASFAKIRVFMPDPDNTLSYPSLVVNENFEAAIKLVNSNYGLYKGNLVFFFEDFTIEKKNDVIDRFLFIYIYPNEKDITFNSDIIPEDCINIKKSLSEVIDVFHFNESTSDNEVKELNTLYKNYKDSKTAIAYRTNKEIIVTDNQNSLSKVISGKISTNIGKYFNPKEVCKDALTIDISNLNGLQKIGSGSNPLLPYMYLNNIFKDIFNIQISLNNVNLNDFNLSRKFRINAKDFNNSDIYASRNMTHLFIKDSTSNSIYMSSVINLYKIVDLNQIK